MPSTITSLSFAIDFPQGLILFTGQNKGAYFLPHDSKDAFMIYGDQKELFGKKAIMVSKNANSLTEKYDLVYEFNDEGRLIDARLIEGQQTIRGTLVDPAQLQKLNAEIGEITFYNHTDFQLRRVFNVASFADGRLLLELSKDELYIGTPGNYTKVDATLEIQGGSEKYYRTADGGMIALVGHGFFNAKKPKFKDEEMTWVNNPDSNPASFGLDLPERDVTPLNPFSPRFKSLKP